MTPLLVYLRPYWRATLLAPLFMMVEVAANLLQPFLMAAIIDKGIANGDISYIIKLGLFMVGLALFGIVGGLGNVVFASIAAQSFGADLRQDMFRKIQAFSFVNLDKFQTASLITRLTNDVVQVQNMVLSMLRILVRAPLLSTGGIIMTFSINPGLASVLLVTIPVLTLSLVLIIKKGFPLFSAVQKKLDKVNAVMRENLTGVRVVKAFVRADYEKKRFGEANSDFKAITLKASRMVGMTMPLMMLIMNLSIVAVVWFGGIRVNSGNMQVGQVMAFINYMTQILFSLLMIAFMLMMVSRAKASAERIVEVINTEVDIKDNPGASDKPLTLGEVCFENVSFRYPDAGGDPVLKNISFVALPGEKIAILGATGAGKTSLVNLIPRFYDVGGGRILLDGRDVREIKLDTLRRSISMVLQESVLFSGTILENIRWGKAEAAEAEVQEAARAAQAHDFITAFPDGYHTLVGQKGVNLSGGQKQRLAIARALLKRPAILILDDSTSAVDLGTEARIQEALKVMLKKTTCFIVAQRITTVLEADKILVLEHGEIAAMGTHQELLKSSAVYQDIYYSQMGEEAV